MKKNVVHGALESSEPGIREQIVVAANEHFSRYGYAKTTMADLAREIGFSKAYLYRFFESKQAIGEAICTQCLTSISSAVRAGITQDSAMERLRNLFRIWVATSAELFFTDRKLYDIAAFSTSESWSSSAAYKAETFNLVREVVVFGRESGEFERKTPLDETCRAILQAMQPFTNPLMLQHNLHLLPDAANEVIALILRSLAP